MTNEVTIHITTADDTAAGRAKTREDFQKLGDDVSGDLDKKLSDGGTKAGKDMGSNASKSAKDSVAPGGGMMATIIAGGLTAGGPLIGAALVGIGVAGLGALGAVLVKGNPAIQAGWQKLASDAKASATQAAQVMVPPLTQALGEIDTLVRSEQPALTDLFAGASRGIEPLTQGLAGLAHNALPGLDNAMTHSTAIAIGLGNIEKDIGSVIGAVGNSVASNSTKIGTDLTSVGTIVKTVGNVLGDLVHISTEIGSVALPILSGGLSLVSGGLHLFSGVLGTIGPEVLAVLGATRLLGSGWLDLAGANKTLTSVMNTTQGLFTDFGGTIDSLRGKTAAATEEQTISAAADREAAATKAALQVEIADLAVTEAEEAVASDASAKNKLALITATEEQAAAAGVAAAAEADLAVATDAAEASMGPIGLLLAGIGAAVGIFAAKTSSAVPPTEDLTNQIEKLAAAAPGARDAILAGSTALGGLIAKLPEAGVSTQSFFNAYNGGAQTMSSFTSGLQKQHDALGQQNVQWNNGNMLLSSFVNTVNRGNIVYSSLNATQKKAVDEYNAQNDVIGQLNTSQGEFNTQAAATASITQDLGNNLATSSVHIGTAADSFDTLIGKMQETKDAESLLQEATAQLLLELQMAGEGGLQKANDALTMFNQQLVSAAKAAKDAKGPIFDTSGALSDVSDKGAAVRTMLEQSQASWSAYATGAEQAGVSSGDMTDHLQTMHDQLEKTMENLGLTKAQADNLIDSFGLIPKNIATQISAPGAVQAFTNVQTLENTLKKLPAGQSVTVSGLTSQAEQNLLNLGYHVTHMPNGTVQIYGDATLAMQAANNVVSRINGMTAWIDIRGNNQVAGAMKMSATGGPVGLRHYDTGGAVGDLTMNEHGGEAVRLPTGSMVIPNSSADAAARTAFEQAGMGGGGGGIVEMRITGNTGFSSFIMNEFRAGRIQLVDGNGKRIKVG